MVRRSVSGDQLELSCKQNCNGQTDGFELCFDLFAIYSLSNLHKIFKLVPSKSIISLSCSAASDFNT